jgi:hypothetical protein
MEGGPRVASRHLEAALRVGGTGSEDSVRQEATEGDINVAARESWGSQLFASGRWWSCAVPAEFWLCATVEIERFGDDGGEPEAKKGSG